MGKPTENLVSKIKLEELIIKQLDPKDSTPNNKHEIRNYIYYGFSNKTLRPRYWKLLLNYYPENKYLHEKFYSNARNSYLVILSDTRIDGEKLKSAKNIIRSEIDRSPVFKDKKDRDAIERILLSFSVINPGIGYVQGMINIANVIYSVMLDDENLENLKFAEEDAFQLFNSLISEMSTLFMSEYDQQNKGLLDRVNEIFEIIKIRDPELYDALVKKELNKVMFPVRWILLLFSAEYENEDIYWIWDKILSDSYRFELVTYLSASVIILMRDLLLVESFETCVIMLQKPHLVSPKLLFDIADLLRRDNREATVILDERLKQSKKNAI